MLAKTVFVVLVATLSVSLAKEDDLVNTILGSGTNIIKEFAKVATNDPDKYSVDLNSLYKKYEVSEKANQARSYLLTQFNRGIELTNEFLKQANLKNEEEIKKEAEKIKQEDSVLGEKYYKLYEKKVEFDRITEDIIKYELNADKIIEKSKTSLQPLEQILAETVKKIESGLLEVIKKSKKI